MPTLYANFTAHCEAINAKFPCDARWFYHLAEGFILDPMFVGSDYQDEGFTLTPGWQSGMIQELCWQGMINDKWSD